MPATTSTGLPKLFADEGDKKEPPADAPKEGDQQEDKPKHTTRGMNVSAGDPDEGGGPGGLLGDDPGDPPPST